MTDEKQKRPLRPTMQTQLRRYLERAIAEQDSHVTDACRLALKRLEKVELLERRAEIDRKLAAIDDGDGPDDFDDDMRGVP